MEGILSLSLWMLSSHIISSWIRQSEDVNDCVSQLYDEFMHAGHVLPIDLLSSIPYVVHLLTRRFPLSYEDRRRIQVLQVWYSQGNL